MEGPPAGLPHLLCKALQPHQVAQPFLDGKLEIFPQQSAVHVLLIGLDDGIGLRHSSTLPSPPATGAATLSGALAIAGTLGPTDLANGLAGTLPPAIPLSARLVDLKLIYDRNRGA
jgi:hypothetical protein